jgi:anti-anti-sigma factor
VAEPLTCQLRTVRPAVTVLDMAGALTADAETALLAAWRPTQAGDTVILNFDKVSHMDGNGLSGLTALAAQAHDRKQTLCLVGLNAQWTPIFALTRLLDDLPVFTSVDGALKELDSREAPNG